MGSPGASRAAGRTTPVQPTLASPEDPSRVIAHEQTDDVGPAEAQSAGPTSCCILHHWAALGAVTAQVAFSEGYLDRYLRIFARAPHTAIEHQRPLPAGLRS